MMGFGDEILRHLRGIGTISVHMEGKRPIVCRA
jgi:hypothetical protein